MKSVSIKFGASSAYWFKIIWLSSPERTQCTSTVTVKEQTINILGSGWTAISALYSHYSDILPNANSISCVHYSQYQHPMSFSKKHLIPWRDAGTNDEGIIFNLTGLDCCQLSVRRFQWGYIRERTACSSRRSSLTSQQNCCWRG